MRFRLREIESRVLDTYGVRAITLLRILDIDVNRKASIELTYVDIFDQQINNIVETP